MDLLTAAVGEHGTTVVLVTHDARSPPTPTARSSSGRQGQHAHRGPAVIPLGLRLVVNGGREAITRLVILSVAVASASACYCPAGRDNAVAAWSSRLRLAVDRHGLCAGRPDIGRCPAVVHPSATPSTPADQPLRRAATAASSPVRLASRMTRPRASTTLARAGPRYCAALRPTSWPIATQAGWRAPSATPGCRRRAR